MTTFQPLVPPGAPPSAGGSDPRRRLNFPAYLANASAKELHDRTSTRTIAMGAATP